MKALGTSDLGQKTHATSLDEALQKPWHTFVCLFTMIQSQDPR